MGVCLPGYRGTLLVAALLFAGCASAPPAQVDIEQTARDVESYLASEHAIDSRGRFKEIFCAVLEEHGRELPDYRPCEQALRITGLEKGATGKPVALGQTQADYLFLFVPGLGWNCFEEWLDPDFLGPRHVEKFGYDVRRLEVDGLSSTANNARMIRDYVAALPEKDRGRPLVLAG